MNGWISVLCVIGMILGYGLYLIVGAILFAIDMMDLPDRKGDEPK